ncbi:deazaflavin-dependent oxidoreductase (nitroreductase family) [Haloactinopolyspora alba]|uniref:Deazaflavin-dependent oxidoreductase (Nitroreductase family) n=1 Tax=Haloactinopolyspora alba TaxID=648780 RepID=A0A2P8E923_9ACTN|nr:nitroreductase family deazaflavin-dependent oxidoreductase [Haloactinopolyspora alba]PSL05972.1 deazaflavin-dependent oxidoreductase (nitroreductase family) [Haloactinopolyspora alba]
MSLRRRLARFNRVFANRIVGGVIWRLPGFGQLCHRGRVSGQEYRTPVKVFRRDEQYVLSLPYGTDSDWVKNVVAAGGCELRTSRRRVRLTAPELYATAEEPAVPAAVRAILNRLNAVDYLALKVAEDTPRA